MTHVWNIRSLIETINSNEGFTGMARYYDAANSFEENFSEPGVTTVIYCRPCGDMVTDAVCVLRREMLTSRNGFSCKGCIMNIALFRQPNC